MCIEEDSLVIAQYAGECDSEEPNEDCRAENAQDGWVRKVFLGYLNPANLPFLASSTGKTASLPEGEPVVETPPSDMSKEKTKRRALGDRSEAQMETEKGTQTTASKLKPSFFQGRVSRQSGRSKVKLLLFTGMQSSRQHSEELAKIISEKTGLPVCFVGVEPTGFFLGDFAHACADRLARDSSYAKEIARVIRQELEEKETAPVFCLAHSWGAMGLGRAADIIPSSVKEHLHVIFMGSPIHRTEEELGFADVRAFMTSGDVMNRAPGNDRQVPYLEFIPSPEGEGPIRSHCMQAYLPSVTSRVRKKAESFPLPPLQKAQSLLGRVILKLSEEAQSIPGKAQRLGEVSAQKLRELGQWGQEQTCIVFERGMKKCRKILSMFQKATGRPGSGAKGELDQP